MTPLAETLRAARVGRGTMTMPEVCSQAELALGIGLSPALVSKWEHGGAVPSLDQLAAIERALQLRRGHLAVAGGYVEMEQLGEPGGVEGAIASAGELDDVARRMLVAAYRAARAVP